MAPTEHLSADNLFNVRQRVALVTGGGTGIGLMCTQALAANGAKVYITGRRMEVLENAAKSHDPSNGGSIVPIGPCDVTSKDSISELVSKIEAKEKCINTLVCASGISGPKADPSSSDAKELKKKLFAEEWQGWTDVWNTDTTAVYFTTVAFLPLLQAATTHGPGANHEFHPSVIVISSMSGMMTHAQSHFSYNAAKAATVHLSKMMAMEFKGTGIRVNSIAPGYFPSEMTTGESGSDNKSEMPEGKIEEKGHVPMGREGSDEEMGMTCLFLARNKYVNGQIIAVDGGVLLEVPS